MTASLTFTQVNPLYIAVLPVLIVEGGALLRSHLAHRQQKNERLDAIEKRLAEVERKTEALK